MQGDDGTDDDEGGRSVTVDADAVIGRFVPITSTLHTFRIRQLRLALLDGTYVRLFGTNLKLTHARDSESLNLVVRYDTIGHLRLHPIQPLQGSKLRTICGLASVIMDSRTCGWAAKDSVVSKGYPASQRR